MTKRHWTNESTLRGLCGLLALCALMLGAQSLAAIPLRLEYTVTGSAAPYTYDFTLMLDDNDGSWVPGQHFGLFVFADGANGSPLSGFTLTAMAPIPFPFDPTGQAGLSFWTFTGLYTDEGWGWDCGGGAPKWMPGAIGETLTWSGTSDSYVATGMTFSFFECPNAAQYVYYLEPAVCLSNEFTATTLVAPPTPVSPTETGPAGNGFEAGKFTLSNETAGTNFTLSAIELTAMGTCEDTTATTRIALYVDNAASGTAGQWDAADTQYGSNITVLAANNGTATFSGALAFAPGVARDIFVVVRLDGSPLPAPTRTLRYMISDVSFSGATPTYPVTTSFMAGLVIQAPDMSIADSSPGAGSASPGAKAVLCSFELAYTEGPAMYLSTTGVLVNFNGGGALSDLVNLEVCPDLNSNNQIDAGETAFATRTPVSSPQNTINTFNPTGAAVAAAPAAATYRYLIVAELASTATIGATFRVSVTALFFDYGPGTWTVANLPTGLSPGVTITAGPYVNCQSPVSPVLVSPAIGTASPEGSYQVDWGNLVSPISVTAPADFEISLTSGSGFGPTLNVGGAGAPGFATVYVRYIAAALGPVARQIVHEYTSGGFLVGVHTVVYGDCNAGSGGTPQIATTTAALLPFTTTAVGAPSAVQSYALSATDMTGLLTITAPANFEVSLSSNTGFGPSLLLPTGALTPPWSGAAIIYVRYNPAAGPGPHGGSISHASPGATTVQVAVSGAIVSGGLTGGGSGGNGSGGCTIGGGQALWLLPLILLSALIGRRARLRT